MHLDEYRGLNVEPDSSRADTFFIASKPSLSWLERGGGFGLWRVSEYSDLIF